MDKRTVVMITNDIDEAILMADRIVPLTPGPSATLGDDFHVPLERPRDRAKLNSCPEFKSLRNECTRYMMRLNRQANEARSNETFVLPDAMPQTFVS